MAVTFGFKVERVDFIRLTVVPNYEYEKFMKFSHFSLDVTTWVDLIDEGKLIDGGFSPILITKFDQLCCILAIFVYSAVSENINYYESYQMLVAS